MEQSIEFRYDTQLLLDVYVEDGQDPDDVADDLVDEIRDHILSTFQGDSMVVAGDSGVDPFGEKATVKLHYHTNEPWLVLEYCRSLGEIFDIVVVNRQKRCVAFTKSSPNL